MQVNNFDRLLTMLSVFSFVSHLVNIQLTRTLRRHRLRGPYTAVLSTTYVHVCIWVYNSLSSMYAARGVFAYVREKCR